MRGKAPSLLCLQPSFNTSVNRLLFIIQSLSLSLSLHWPIWCSLTHMNLFTSWHANRQARDKHGHYLLCPCVVMLIHWEVYRLHLWKGLRTFFLLLGGFPLSGHVSLDSGRWPPGMKKPVWLGGGENGGAPAPGGWWLGGPEGKKPPLAAMSFGGPPLKMRLKKSCKSAGLVGPGACSEGALKVKVGGFRHLLYWSFECFCF